jgi:hypothetical protein
MFCLRNISVDILHKGDTEDNNNNFPNQNEKFGQRVRCTLIELSYGSCKQVNRYGVVNRHIFGISALKGKFQGMKLLRLYL